MPLASYLSCLTRLFFCFPTEVPGDLLELLRGPHFSKSNLPLPRRPCSPLMEINDFRLLKIQPVWVNGGSRSGTDTAWTFKTVWLMATELIYVIACHLSNVEAKDKMAMRRAMG